MCHQLSANEKRKVRCFDIPSAFVNTDVDEDVLMVLKGELADMMTQIVPQVYRKYVTINKKATRGTAATPTKSNVWGTM